MFTIILVVAVFMKAFHIKLALHTAVRFLQNKLLSKIFKHELRVCLEVEIDFRKV